MDTTQNKNKSRLTTILILVGVVGGCTALYFLLKANNLLEIFTSIDRLQEEVQAFGTWAPVAFILLQIAQVIFAPIPGNVTTLAGGAMFGFWPAFLYSALAIFVGSLLAFGLGRAYGRPLVYKLAPKEVVDKYLVVLASRQKLTLSLLFIFPLFPDDILCLLAGLTGYSWKWFAGMVLLTRPWGLLFSALIGSGTLDMPLWGWVLIVIAAAGMMFVSIKYGSRMEEWLLKKIHKA